MAEQEYFRKALSDFTFDVASGGAIRHLADRGYTVSQIKDMLDFPTPLERVGQAVWQHMVDTGRLMFAEPEAGNQREQYTYVLEYDAYGKSSYQRVTVQERDAKPVRWKERQFSGGEDRELSQNRDKAVSAGAGRELPGNRDKMVSAGAGRELSGNGGKPLSVFLAEKCAENGEEYSYVSCDFGLRSRREPEKYQQVMKLLEESQRDYIQGLPWERRLVYHRLDDRMQGIIARLYEAGEYHGTCYFVKTEEKIQL